jgi:hypothetical protein
MHLFPNRLKDDVAREALNCSDAEVRDRARPAALIALVVAVIAFTAAPGGHAVAQTAKTHLVEQLYLTGLARVARGDPASAESAFRVASEVAPGVPQIHYSLALTMMLSDFGRRERALSEIDKALAADPQQPLFSIVRVMADPALSTLRNDGALYLTPDGAARLRGATDRLGNASDGYNARYLAPVLSRLEPTGESAHPYRLDGFASMVGQRGTVRLSPMGEAPQAFGRLFVVSVPDAQFSPYEGGFVSRLRNGLNDLSLESAYATRSRARAEALRNQILASPPP